MITMMLALAGVVNVSAVGQIPIPADPSGQLDLGTYACRTYLALVEAEDGRADVHTVWAHGYHSALQGVDETHREPLTFETLLQFAQQLQQTCSADPDKLFLSAVKELGGP